MSHKEIGLNIYIDNAWQKQKQKQYDAALMWYHNAFEPLKSIFDQIQLETDPLSWFKTLPRYHKISYEKLFAFVFNCGLVEFEVQNFETSLYYFSLCKKLDVLNCMPFIYSAFALFLQGKQKDAFQQIAQSIDQLQNSLNNEIALSELYCIYALLHHRKNEMQIAIDFCDRALSLHPTSIIALIIKADSIKFRSASKKQEEIDLYHQILSIDSQNAIRFVGKGFLAVDNLGWLIRFRDLFFFYSQSYKSVNLDLLEQTYSKKSNEELFNSFVYFGNIVFAAQEKKNQMEPSQQVTLTELVTNKASPKTNKTIHRNYDKPWLQNAKKPKLKNKPTETEGKHVTKAKRSYAKPWKQSKLTTKETSSTMTAKVEFASNAPSTSKMSLYKLSDSTTDNAPTITITSSVNPNTMMKPKDTPFVSIINGKAIRFDTLVQQLREKQPSTLTTASEMSKKQAEKRIALLKTSGSTLFEKEVKRSPTPPTLTKKTIPKKPTLVPNQVQLNSSIIPGSVEEVMNFEKSTLTPAKNIITTNSKIPYSLPLLVS